MTNAIKITLGQSTAALLEDYPWVILDEQNSILAVYKSRTLAREAKAGGLQGSIKNKSELEIKVTQARGPITHESTVERPCKLVWAIADEMKGQKRGKVLAACVEAGIAFYTARTQYQQWLGIQKEMAEREAQQAAAKK